MKKILIILTLFFCFISNAQIITTVAGNGYNTGPGTGGFSGDGGPATAAALWSPQGLAFDAAGNLYISDSGNNRVRKVTTSGIISTIAGLGTKNLSGDGGQATAAEVYFPIGLAVDASNNIFIADKYNNRVRMINTIGIITTFAGSGGIYPSAGGYSGDNGQATDAGLYEPTQVAFDASGNLFIADFKNNRVRKVNTTGIITTVAGGGLNSYPDGGQATNAIFTNPNGLAFDVAGNLFITDYNDVRIKKVNTAGIITTAAGNGIPSYSGDGGQATNAEINYSAGLTVDAAGNLYIADQDNYRIRKVNTSSIITTVAGGGPDGVASGVPATDIYLSQPTAVAIDAYGNLFIGDSNDNLVRMVSPALAITVNSATICSGTTTTLTANGANTFSWSPSTGLSATTGSLVIATPSVTTTYTITGATNYTAYGVAAISTGTTSSTITVLASPTITVNNASLCIGQTATLTAAGANTYTWSSNAGSLTTNTVLVSPTTTTNYTVTGTTGICSTLNTSTVTVFNSANISLANNTYTICNGSSQTFTATGASTYTWTPSASLSNSNLANPIANPTTTTVYSVSGTNACGLSSPLTLTLSINPNPAVTVNSPNICVGGTAILTANGASTYTWSTGTTANTITVTPATTKNYTVTGTDANNCVNKAVAAVTIIPTPTVNLLNGPPNSHTFCSGTLNNQIYFRSNPAGNFSWTNNNTATGVAASGGGDSLIFSIASLTVQTVGIITVNAITNIAGCASTNSTNLSFTITVLPHPGITTPTITPAACGQSNGTIIGASGTGGTSGYRYYWNNIYYATNSPSYTNAAGTYTLEVEDASTNCHFIETFTIPNANTPSPPIITLSATQACVGDAIVLHAPAVSDTTYNWTEANGNTGTGASYTVANIPNTPNPYQISVTPTFSNCTGAASTFTIMVNPLPSINIVSDTNNLCLGNTATLTASGATSYIWNTGATSPTITVTPTANTTYSVVGSDANNCTNSNTITQVVSNCNTTNINTLPDSDNELNIYPNPNNGNFVVEPNNNTKQTITIYDVNNKAVLNQTINGKTSLDASSLNDGVYNINIISTNSLINRKLIIVK
jgi:sugar lactone lactonase YvrE